MTIIEGKAMATFEVETDLIIYCRVKVRVEADSRESAIDAVAEILPANHDPDRAEGWRATVSLRPPKNVNLRVVKAYHFEQASGADKARKVAE